MDDQLTVRISAPEAELDHLSLWEDDPAAVREWVGSLPMANTAEAATQIRQATFEIARVKTDFPNRMDLLEAIRPTLHYLCARLDRTATATSTHSDAIARLAQRLQTNLCSGYKAVILAGLANRDADNAVSIVALAIHRALSDLSRTLLRTLQFYVAPADRLWLELNQLYLLAERLGVHTQRREDSENHSEPEATATQAYLRSVLLAISKPNQLRHRQLGQVFNALECWTPDVSIDGGNDSLFMVDLDSDQGPRYTRLLHSPAEPRGIRTEVLVYELEAYLKDMPSRSTVPDYVGADLLDHLVDAWGVMRQRAFTRAPASGSVKVCVGLRSAHYYMSGGVEFVDQLDQTDAILKREVNPFLVDYDRVISEKKAPRASNSRKDVWDDAFDLRVKIPLNPKIQDPDRILLQGYGRGKQSDKRKRDATVTDDSGAQALHYYDTTAVDTSPGGYRIRWNEPLPASVQAGELVAMRDATDPRWCVAVIRWIRQDNDGTSMGIELISPRAIPLALRLINKRRGESEFARGLLLPALEPINQPATLITPVLPFQAGQKIHIQRQGIQTTAQLSQCILKTESVNQFTFRMLDGYLENALINLNMSDLSELDGLISGDF